MSNQPPTPPNERLPKGLPGYVCTYTGEVVEHSGDDMFRLKVKTLTENGKTKDFPDVEPVLCHHSRWLRSAEQERLEYLRGELRAERISYGELVELQSLVAHIEPGDTELLEAAGVPEGTGGADAA